MEIYDLTLHFPPIYGTLDKEELTLKSTEYYDSNEQAIERAVVIAHSFVTPKPEFWYLEDGDRNVWTDNPERTKKALHYELLSCKPNIVSVNDSEIY